MLKDSKFLECASKIKCVCVRCIISMYRIFTVALSRGLQFFVLFYQKSFSLLIGRSCRFYPSCSNYALWLLDFNKPFIALFKSTHRIFRCSPLSRGGIDYPILSLCISPHFYTLKPQQKHIKYWLLPYKNSVFLATILCHKQIKGTFVIIKSF